VKRGVKTLSKGLEGRRHGTSRKNTWGGYVGGSLRRDKSKKKVEKKRFQTRESGGLPRHGPWEGERAKKNRGVWGLKFKKGRAQADVLIRGGSGPGVIEKRRA